MKRTLLLIGSLLAIHCYSNAQEFTLTPSGLVDTSNPQNSYIVLEFEGKSQQEIFKSTEAALARIYNSLKEVMSKSEYSDISVMAIQPDAVLFGIWGYRLTYTMKYYFKDNKMRISANVVSIKHDNPSATISQIPIPSIFDKDGAVKKSREKTKLSIEVFFNALVSGIKSEITSAANKKEDEW